MFPQDYYLLMQFQENKMLDIPESLCSDLTDEQASTVQGGLFVLIDKIKVNKAGADGGIFPTGDDPYITINGKKVFQATEVFAGDVLIVNQGRNVGKSGTIRLTDKDYWWKGQGSDDPLGQFKVSSPTGGKVKKQTISGSGSEYEVSYRAFG